MGKRKVGSVIVLVCIIATFFIASFFFFDKALRVNKSSIDPPQKNDTAVRETKESSTIGAAASARAMESAFGKLKDDASQFGIDLWPSDADNYIYIRERLLKNEELASALRTTKDAGVTIFLSRKFYISTGWVYIDAEATDQEIIEFLLGKQS